MVPLGELFGTLWRLVQAKLVPKPALSHLLVEKVVVHETVCFPMVVDVVSPDMAPQNDPRWLHDGFGIVLIASFCIFRFHSVLEMFLASFWLRFGCQNRTLGAHGCYEIVRAGGPRRCWGRLGSVLFSSCDLGSIC